MYLLFQQGRDRVSSILFAAQTVEKHRTLHRCKGHRLEFLLQGIPGRLHQGGVEGPAHLQRQAALCTGQRSQYGGLVNSGLVTANDQLAGAVVVADLYNARIGSGVAAALQGIAVQSQHSGHAAVAPGSGCSHGFPAKGRQRNGGTGIKYACAGQRRVFAERKTGSVVGCDAGSAQHGGDAACKGGHAGLGVLGFVQHTRCIGKADLL